MADAKIALVTGASRGIGKAVALALAHDGYIVVGTATTDSGVELVDEHFQSDGVTGLGQKVNVANDESVALLIESINEKYGAPQILINNAGITRDNLLLRMTSAEWHEVIETNLSSIYRVTKACLRGMTRARWGRIVNISSVVASSGNAGQTNYCASKAGIDGFTRSLAKEVGSRGITVNSVAPGFIDTDMTRDLPQQQSESLISQIPLGRLGQPKEIASVVAFLASDRGAYITGETLHVNGGMYLG